MSRTVRSKPETILLLRQRKGNFFVFVNNLNLGYGIYSAGVSVWDEWQEH